MTVEALNPRRRGGGRADADAVDTVGSSLPQRVVDGALRAALGPALADSDGRVRARCMSVLEALLAAGGVDGATVARVLPLVVEFAGDGDPRVRWAAARGCAAAVTAAGATPGAAEQLAALVTTLRVDPDEAVRLASLELAAALAGARVAPVDEMFATLSAAMLDTNMRVRSAAVVMMGDERFVGVSHSVLAGLLEKRQSKVPSRKRKAVRTDPTLPSVTHVV